MRGLTPPPMESPRCRKCGYDLRGWALPRCSECGEPFDPDACPDCRGRGRVRIVPPVWVCVLGIVVACLLFVWLRHSLKPKDVMTWLLPALLSIGGMSANILRRVDVVCSRCGGSGRARADGRASPREEDQRVDSDPDGAGEGPS